MNKDNINRAYALLLIAAQESNLEVAHSTLSEAVDLLDEVVDMSEAEAYYNAYTKERSGSDPSDN